MLECRDIAAAEVPRGALIAGLKNPSRWVIFMVTVYRAYGLRAVIYLDDHEPAHVHVFGDGQAKINLIGPDGKPELLWKKGMKNSEARRDMMLVAEQQLALLARWRQIHG